MQRHVAAAAVFLKALANEQRLLILCSLLEGSLSVSEINNRVSLTQSALSQHLALLRMAGFVTTRRESQTIYYTLAQGPALKVMDILYETFCAKRTPRRAQQSKRRSTRAQRIS